MKENNKSRILNEKELSDVMNGFHNAVIPLENCKILQAKEDTEIIIVTKKMQLMINVR